MIEEVFFQDEGLVKITAASVGISSRRWICINSTEIVGDNYKAIMKDKRFDILPIVSGQVVTEFFKTKKPNQYEEVIRVKITYKDVIPLDTSIRDVINMFAGENRTFYFLAYHHRIIGLLTLGNLNCRQVQVYIFSLVCELERRLGEFIQSELSEEEIESFIKQKADKSSDPKNKYLAILDNYQKMKKNDLENRLIECLYLSNLFEIIEEYELFVKFNYSKSEWKKLGGINDLRHSIAHPTRSVIKKQEEIEQLCARITKIEDLTFRLNQIDSE